MSLARACTIIFIYHRRRNQGGTGGLCPPNFALLNCICVLKINNYFLCPPLLSTTSYPLYYIVREVAWHLYISHSKRAGGRDTQCRSSKSPALAGDLPLYSSFLSYLPLSRFSLASTRYDGNRRGHAHFAGSRRRSSGLAAL